MRVPGFVRDRLSADDVPAQAYVLVGASVQLRRQWDDVAGRALAVGDRCATTGRELAAQTRRRIGAAPGDAAAMARGSWDGLTAAPARTVAGVRSTWSRAAQEYASMATEGERAVAEWHAERLLNERAERVARSVTPGAAKAAVSARDAAKRAAASPTGRRVGAARRRAAHAWAQYLQAIEETGAAGWGDAAVNGSSAASVRR